MLAKGAVESFSLRSAGDRVEKRFSLSLGTNCAGLQLIIIHVVPRFFLSLIIIFLLLLL